MIDTDRKLLQILETLLPTLKWLDAVQPVYADQIPAEHQSGLKQLEALGLAYKRNSKTYGLQKQRLKKILARSSDTAVSSWLEQQLFSPMRGQSNESGAVTNRATAFDIAPC